MRAKLNDKDKEFLKGYWQSLFGQDYKDALLMDDLLADKAEKIILSEKLFPFKFIDIEEEDGNN